MSVPLGALGYGSASGSASNPGEDPNGNAGQGNNQWSWSGVMQIASAHAKDLSAKAQEFGEIAKQKAQELADKAREMEVEKAADMIMSFGTGVPGEAARSPKKRLPRKDLDLHYITENVISMAFPYDYTKPGAVQGGNDIDLVSLFMRKKHGGHFMVWNVSEESYDYSKFAEQVLEYQFPGHPAPPLGLLFKICTSVESWLDADERNVAVVHCLTGKGRTAALVACILTWIGEFSSPIEALQYVADRRGISVDYLTIPSQRRYVQYFSNMLDGVKPRSEPLLLRRVIINSIPIFGDNNLGENNKGCCPYVQLFKNGRLIATAVPHVETDPTGADTPGGEKQAQQRISLKWIRASEGSASFNVDIAVQGDILLRCRHADVSGARVSMFRAAFHTGYVPVGVLRLTKAQLDGTVNDSRFDEEFFMDLIFAPIERAPPAPSADSAVAAPGVAPPQPQATGVPTDSGLFIDPASSDKYELTLHRDTRFWEAVAARKSKSKKRRARKFLAASQEQFSISEEAGKFGSQDSDEMTFSALKAATVTASTTSANDGVSDAELIAQLASMEDDALLAADASTPRSPSAAVSSGSGKDNMPGEPVADKAGGGPSSSSSAALTNTAANSELLALQELEKELGLDDLNLFATGPTTAPAAVSTPGKSDSGNGDSNATKTPAAPAPTPATAAKPAGDTQLVDDDNLDELERYLQSLST